MKLHLGEGLSLPLDAVTQKLAFLGRTGSGKTYAASRLAEEMLAADAQIVALDPVGVWWGLRLAADGKSPGISIPVFGGLHGDVPLEPTAGKLLADLVVDRGISAVLDVSQFESDAAKARFARDFANRFFFRKKSAPSAVHVFLEECQEFVPQNPTKDEPLMLHAFTRLIKLGRNFGVGASLISQRPQEVNKKALNMTECLLAFQMTGPHERKTVESWIAEKGLDLDIVADLPKLAVGTAHVWSPAWLRISKTVKIAAKRTFNASSTPEVGKRAQSRALAPIDLEQLRERMAETIERAKAEDPALLRKALTEKDRKIRDLEAGLALAVKTGATKQVERVEVPVLSEDTKKRLDAIGDACLTLSGDLESLIQEVRGKADSLRRMDREMAADVRDRTPAPTPRREPPPPVRRTAPASANGRDHAGDPEVGKGGLRRILVALAQRPQGLSHRQIGVRAGLSTKGGTFSTYISRARTAGWIEGGAARVTIVGAGLAALGSYDPLPSGEDLLRYWVDQLSGGASRMLVELASAYPEALSNDQLASRAGVSSQGGTFSTYVSRLRSLELITGGRGELRASEELFS